MYLNAGPGGGVSYIFPGGEGGGNWKLHFSGTPLKTMVKGVGMFDDHTSKWQHERNVKSMKSGLAALFASALCPSWL